MTLPAPFNKDLKVLVLAGANQVPSGDLNEVSRYPGGETPLEAKSFLRLLGPPSYRVRTGLDPGSGSATHLGARPRAVLSDDT